MLINFLETDEAQEIIWLDYCGYHLCGCQGDLTIIQSYFLAKGRMDLHEEMNKVD